MATSSTLFSPVKVERLPSPTPQKPPRLPSSESNLIGNQAHPQPTNANTVDIPPPDFINSITGLRNLSNALSSFLSRYDELHQHLDSIKTSIDSKLPNHLLTTTDFNQLTLIPSPGTSRPAPVRTPPAETDFRREKPSEIKIELRINQSATTSDAKSSDVPEKHVPFNSVPQQKPSTHGESPIPETKIEQQLTKVTANDCDGKPEAPEKPARSELEKICEMMCGRSLKRYVVTHISEVDKLLDEVPKAMKIAKDPAKLALEGVGRFYLQGSRAYNKASLMIPGRVASIIILECFLLMSSDGVDISKEVKEEAAKAAIDWRRRLLSEGGLAKADEPDARGLLLLISGFGIPGGVFKNEDIRALIRAANVKGISTALRRSVILIPKIPEMIDWMVKNNMEVDAVDIAYTFGLEDKCSPRTILTTFLRKKINSRPHGSSAEVKEAIEKQLADLKSITHCLETHKVDPSKLLPEWNISEKVASFEKEVSELDSVAVKEKATMKRKAIETESSNKSKQQEGKRSRFAGQSNVPHQQKAIDHGDGKSSYIGSTQASNHVAGRLPSDYINIYPTAASVLRGSALPENITSSVAVGSGRGLSGVGMLTSPYGGGTVADQIANKANGQPYDWRKDAAFIERYMGQTYSSQTQTYDPQPSSSGLIGLYSRSSGSKLEGFPGLPNLTSSVGASARVGSALDLYHFADSVVENESHRPSGVPRAAGDGAMHPFLSSHHSSYLY